MESRGYSHLALLTVEDESGTGFQPRMALSLGQNEVEFVYFQDATKARIQAGFRSLLRRKPAKNSQFPKKTEKNRRKPVEMRCFPLTNPAESRKVNGGRVSLDPHQCLRSSHSREASTATTRSIEVKTKPRWHNHCWYQEEDTLWQQV